METPRRGTKNVKKQQQRNEDKKVSKLKGNHPVLPGGDTE